MTNFLDSLFEKDRTDISQVEGVEAYDPDTLHGVPGAAKGVRIKGVDAPEAPTLRYDRYGRPIYTEGLYEPEHKRQLEEAIDEGYSFLDQAGTDAYGRTLAHLQTKYGHDYAVEYMREGRIDGSRYAIDDINIGLAYTQGQMDNFINSQKDLPDWRKGEIVNSRIQNVVPLGPMDLDNAGVFAPVDQDYQNKGAFDIMESIEYWWMSNKTAYEGIVSLFDQDGAKRRIEDINEEFAGRIDPNLVVSLEQIDSAGDALAWMGNNLIIQGPDFAIIAGGGATGAAIGSAVPIVGTAVGGFIGSAVGLGYTWLKGTGSASAEYIETHGEANVGHAMAIGTGITILDKLGARGVIKPTEYLTKEGQDKLVEHIAKKEGIELVDAQKLLDQESMSVMRKFYDEVEFATSDFLSKRNIALRIARETGRRGAGEALTELSQEGMQYVSIHGIPETAEEWKRMGIRLADAAAAGGVVGTAYQAPQSLRDRAQIEDWRQGTLPWDYDTATRYEKEAYDAFKTWGFTDVEDAVQEYSGEVSGDDIHERAKRSSGNYLVRAGRKLARGDFRIGGSAIRNTFNRKTLYNDKGEAVKAGFLLANIEGAMQNMSGHTLYNMEEQRVARIAKQNPWLEDTQKYLEMDSKEVEVMLNKLYLSRMQLMAEWTDAEKTAARKIIAGLTNTNNQINSWKGFVEEDTFSSVYDTPTHLLQPDLPNVKKVKHNFTAAVDKLANMDLDMHYQDKKPGDKLGKELATQLLNDVIEYKGTRDTAKVLHNLKAFENAPELFADNAIDRLADKIVQETRQASQQQMRGRDLQTYSNILNEMERKGVPQEIVDELAADLIDQVAKHNKTFGRLKNEVLSHGQDYLRTATSMGVMDLSLFAQPGEAAIAAIGTDQSMVKHIANIAHGSFLSNVNYYNELTGKDTQDEYREYQELGYSAEEIIAQHGVAFDSKINQAINKHMFKVFQVSQTQDAIRMSRMWPAAKVITNLGASLIDKDLNNLTKKDMKTFERIRFLGGNPQDLVTVLKAFGTIDVEEVGNQYVENEAIPAEVFEDLSHQWDVMLPKFIDELAVRVKPGSRPSFFEDKRFGLPFLTQYLSFTAHWHANQLPRLYTQYLKGGGPKLAYTAFAFAASSILVAYMSQFLKDWLVHGEHSPYLKENTGAIERALLYSGLLGWVGEGYDRYISGPYGFGAAHEALTNKDRTLIGELLTGTLESPTISHFEKLGEKVVEGEYKEAAKRGLPFGNVRGGDLYDFLTGKEN